MRDIPPVPDHEIELSGGALALDFANTVGGTHIRPTHDHLRGYADILRFAVMAGGLEDDVAKRLTVRAQREPMRAAAVYELGIDLREAVWAVFSAACSCVMILSCARFNHSNLSRSSWLIAIRPIP